MPGEGTYSGQAIAPGVGIEQRVQQLMERGLSQQEAVAQAQRETQQQGQGNGQRSAIMQALATAAQRPSVEVPVAQPPNPKLRILQALGLLKGDSRSQQESHSKPCRTSFRASALRRRANVQFRAQEAVQGLCRGLHLILW